MMRKSRILTLFFFFLSYRGEVGRMVQTGPCSRVYRKIASGGTVQFIVSGGTSESQIRSSTAK